MATPVLMPRWGMIMEEGFIVSWMKQEGDDVETGDVLAEIESEKVTNDLEAPVSGKLARVVVSEGETAGVGSMVAVIAGPGDTDSDIDTCISQQPPVPDSGPETIRTEPSRETGDHVIETTRKKVTPAARKIAGDNGIDASRIQGTGPDRRVQVRDVQRVLSMHHDPTGSLTPLRRAIAERTARSISIPQAALYREIDISAVTADRRRLKAETGRTCSLTAAILSYIAGALMRVPELNGTFTSSGYRTSRRVHLGIVVAVDGGVIVPVIRDAEKLSIADIDATLTDLVARAHSQDLRAEEVAGSTFTVSNAGMLGVDLFQPLLNPPEVAGLGIGRIKRRPVISGDDIIIGTTAFFSVTTDHRIIDAAPAGAFLSALDEMVQNGITDYE